MQTIMKLEKPAKNLGGDRYTDGTLTIYVPQEVSRKDGKPADTVKVTIEPVR